MFEKLHKYIGKNVETLVNRKDQPHVFRLHKKVRAAGMRGRQLLLGICSAGLAKFGSAPPTTPLHRVLNLAR